MSKRKPESERGTSLSRFAKSLLKNAAGKARGNEQKPQKRKAIPCVPVDAREVQLKAPPQTPSPIREAYDAVSDALQLAAMMQQTPPQSDLSFGSAARELSAAFKAARKQYEIASEPLQAAADASCAHQDALNSIRRVNDACGHVMRGIVPSAEAENHLQSVPIIDVSGTLASMARQRARASLLLPSASPKEKGPTRTMPIIFSVGERRYAIGDDADDPTFVPILVTKREDDVLLAFVENSSLTETELIQGAGNYHRAPRTLLNLTTRYDEYFAMAIHCPGRKGSGGYRAIVQLK